MPIPRQTSASTLTIKYYPLSFVKPVISVTFALAAGDRTTCAEIKERVRQSILDQALEEGEQVTLDDIHPPIICIAKDSRVERMAKSDTQLCDLEKGYRFVAVERPDHDRDTSKVVAVQLMVTQHRSSYMIWKTQQPLTQTRIMVLNKDSSVRDIKKQIFRLFRPII